MKQKHSRGQLMHKWKNEELEKTLAEVLRRSAVDLEFRTLALKDGRGAIARINPRLSVNELVFRFVDNSGPTITVVLPDLVREVEENELSEKDLEIVTGGTDAPPPPPPTTIQGG
jgi:hypothetical protein